MGISSGAIHLYILLLTYKAKYNPANPVHTLGDNLVLSFVTKFDSYNYLPIMLPAPLQTTTKL